MSMLDKRINTKEVFERYKMGKTQLKNAVKNGAFPKPHKLAGGRKNYWWESELLEYEKKYKEGFD
jgi:predicted DNA-binding transcriptional regulator AlpA